MENIVGRRWKHGSGGGRKEEEEKKGFMEQLGGGMGKEVGEVG
jgi:hypothetical protein